MKYKARNRKSNKNKNINSIYRFTFDIVKLLALFIFVCCLFLFFIFDITYMNSNKFFSYDLLSIENLWVVVAIFLQSYMFGLLYLPINLALYSYRRKDYITMIVSLLLSIVLIVFIVLLIITNGVKNLHWIIYCLFMAFICCIIIELFIQFYNDRNSKKLLAVLVIVFVSMVYFAFTFPDIFNAGFKKFLIDKSLAADKVEVYLKDKGNFVFGKMVFRDSKFAYIQYKDNVLQLVPLENVTILEYMEQQ